MREAALTAGAAGAGAKVPDTDAVFQEYGATPRAGRTAETASEQKVPSAQSSKEQSYIPLSVAQSTIRRMASDMENMREHHAGLLAKVQGYYAKREEATREHYVKYIDDMRARADSRIKYYKTAAGELRDRLEGTEKRLDAEQSSAAGAATRHAEEAERLKASIGADGSDYEIMRERLQEAHRAELAELQAQVDASGGATSEETQALAAQLAQQKEAFQSIRNAMVAHYDEQLDDREAVIAQLRVQSAQLQAQVTALSAVTVAAANSQQQAISSSGDAASGALAAELAKAKAELQHLRSEASSGKGGWTQQQPNPTAAPAAAASTQGADSSEREAQLRELLLLPYQQAVTDAEAAAEARSAACGSLQDDADSLHDQYKGVKGSIKAWLVEYKERTGVDADKEAKKAIRDEYRQYEALSAQHKEALQELDDARAASDQAQEDVQTARRTLQQAEQAVQRGDAPPALRLSNAGAEADLLAASEKAARLQTRLAAAEDETAALQARLDAREASAGAGGTVSAAELELVEAELARARDDATQAAEDAAAAKVEVQSLQRKLAAAQDSSGAASPAGSGDDDAAALSEELDAALAEKEELQEEVRALKEAAQEARLDFKMQLAEAAAGAAGDDDDAAAASGGGDAALAPVLEALIDRVGGDIDTAKGLWKDKKKSAVCELLQDTIQHVLAELQPHGHAKLPPVREALETAQDNASAEGVKASKAALELRKTLDAFVQDAAVILDEVQGAAAAGGGAPKRAGGGNAAAAAAIADLRQELAAARAAAAAAQASAGSDTPKTSSSGGGGGGSTAVRTAQRKAEKAEKMNAALKSQLQTVKAELEAAKEEAARGGGGRGGGGASSGPSAAEGKLKDALEKEKGKVKEKDGAIKTMKAEMKKLQGDLARAEKGSGAAASEADKEVKRAQRQLEAELKKAAKASDEAVGKVQRDLNKKTAEAEALAGQVEELQGAVAAASGERDQLKAQVDSLGELQGELENMRAKMVELKEAKAAIVQLEAQGAELAKLYKEEQVKRKKLHNKLEDLKGKVRVYARCRPPNRREKDLKSPSVVGFLDEMTMSVDQSHGAQKQFVYDQVFGPTSTQEQVYSEMENLVQSAYDGFNVCVFAYGQTGSGKTFTMVGVQGGESHLLGITPRAIAGLFALIEENKDSADATVTCTMVEIYNDQLRDLFFLVENERAGGRLKAPKLDIKMDKKKRVFISGSQVRAAGSPQDVLSHFDEGNGVRKVGSTKMNAESSRSHLVFNIMIEVNNKTTGKTSMGKLTLVDLAGSERVGKTGADAERLREAQSINRSLAALGNVINALSTAEAEDGKVGHVPYRDNLLTRLLQDGLGGSAKTLMFVNVSPAEDNAEETVSSLQYAERVKKITNTASKSEESKEVRRLKNIIRRLRKGEAADDPDAAEDAAEDEGEEETAGAAAS